MDDVSSRAEVSLLKHAARYTLPAIDLLNDAVEREWDATAEEVQHLMGFYEPLGGAAPDQERWLEDALSYVEYVSWVDTGTGPSPDTPTTYEVKKSGRVESGYFPGLDPIDEELRSKAEPFDYEAAAALWGETEADVLQEVLGEDGVVTDLNLFRHATSPLLLQQGIGTIRSMLYEAVEADLVKKAEKDPVRGWRVKAWAAAGPVQEEEDAADETGEEPGVYEQVTDEQWQRSPG